MTKDEVLMMALEALKANDLLINGTEKAGGLAWCIDGYYSDCFDIDPINEQTERAITAIKEALAQHDSVQAKPEPEQEPVAMVESVATVVSESGNQEVTMSWWHEPALPVGTKLYTTPPQRKPLTSKEIRAIEVEVAMSNSFAHPTKAEEFVRAIEAAHGIRD